jgi:chemotaxis protein CheD
MRTPVSPRYSGLLTAWALQNNMRVIVIGGARVNDRNDYFNIGKRNFIATRKIFWKNNVMINYKDVGGTNNRTLRMWIRDGRAQLRTSGRTWVEIG